MQTSTCTRRRPTTIRSRCSRRSRAAFPVVAPHVGGIPEQLTEDTGVLLGPGDAPGLARAIGDLLADDGRRARMGEAAAADARARFALERQVDAYLDLYASVAG